MININKICQHFSLGEPKSSLIKIASGLTNEVFLLATTEGKFVIKRIDLGSVRARPKREYQYTENLAAKLHSLGIPTVVALAVNQNFILAEHHHIILAYPFISGEVLYGPIGPVSEEDAKKSGTLLGLIHQLNIRYSPVSTSFGYSYVIPIQQWHEYIDTAKQQKLSWYTELGSKLETFLNWNRMHREADQRLAKNLIYSHGDYFPHNLMWHDNKPILIDWELAGRINPSLEFALALILFSGFATENQFNRQVVKFFLDGYYATGACLRDDLDDAIWGAIGKAWLNWMAFQAKRSLDKKLSKEERQAASQTIIAFYSNLETLLARIPLMKSLLNT
ncbi:phosphotransferase [Legionella jamestowniensis]|uniref:Putative aminoglycoside phosphotransferase n=1 Tax=Legionella jamestowniensis TaxID=455 RepID=A0A0W0UKL7_9GAMM|nr:phosphotransferase [Legionella jamestowniensis]KTD08247.1 putative aminoglycoside phosphotransferase [Legionella jamestowniensis]OCH98569.1 hypothetical protein A8135_00560 [Legionella jamestowniensis]SFL97935.1 Predicted kinase, aminoglycoside phosphotransferase (APT) family [Legionella jamestowniensis DSM 19215]